MKNLILRREKNPIDFGTGPDMDVREKGLIGTVEALAKKGMVYVAGRGGEIGGHQVALWFIKGISAPEGDRTVRVLRFFHKLQERALAQLDDPGFQETLAMMLEYAFVDARKGTLKCQGCCPTPAARRRAKANLFDPRTFSVKLDAYGCKGHTPTTTSGGHASTKFGFVDKIFHRHFAFPECLPPTFANADLSWIDDDNQLDRCLETIVETNYDMFGMQSRSDLFRCHGHDPDHPAAVQLKETLDDVDPAHFVFTVHCVDSVNPEERNFMNLSVVPVPSRTRLRTEPVHEDDDDDATVVASDHKISYMAVDLRSCDHCGVEEQFARSFKVCASCHAVTYCSRECQTAAWSAHKKICSKPSRRRSRGKGKEKNTSSASG